MKRPAVNPLPLRELVLVLFCCSLSGCALLRLPFDILNGVWRFIQKVPLPPPWVF